MINLLPHAVVEQLADRIARLLQATLQARLASSVGSGMGGGGSGSGGHGGYGGGSGSGSNRRSNSFGAMFANYFHPNQQTSSGDGNRARGSSPASSGPPRSGLFDRFADWYGQRQARQAIGNQGQDWWRRGWGNRAGSQGAGSGGGDQQPSLMQRIVNRFTGNSGKKSAFARASRLKVIAQRRLSVAKAAVKASNAARGQAGWHPAAHGALLATQRAAQQKVAQATALQARATGLGAAASGRVAAGLSTLASKIPVIGMFIAAGAAGFKAGLGASRIPSRIAEANDSRINSMRPNANFSAQIAGALAGYDLRMQLRQASMARATAESGSYLISQQNRLQDALQPIRERLADVQNNAMGWLAEKAADVVNRGVKAVDETAVQAELIRQQAEWLAGQRPANQMQTADEIRAEMQEMERQKAKEKLKPQETMFDFAMSAWTTSIEHKKDARQNNKPRPPLRPVK